MNQKEKTFNDFINKRLYKEKKQQIRLNQLEKFSKYNLAGVYVVWKKNSKTPVYVGESKNLLSRIKDLRDTWNHTLRRKIGDELGCKRDKIYPRKFSKKEDEEKITKFIESKLLFSFFSINFGRKEIEECMINKFPKMYNSPIKRVGKE